VPDNQLFNISSTMPAHSADAASGAPPGSPSTTGSIGVITASQSAITFAGAPAAVTLMWKVIGVASSTAAASKVLPIVLSLVIGMLIYWQTQSPGVTRREKVIGFAFALINSFAIAAAALGIDSVGKP
jgi:hypothetical protein